jgi:hypothetical protein
MFDVCAFFCVCVVLCLCREALRRADHPFKESYRLWMIKKLINQPYAPKWEQRGRKKIFIAASTKVRYGSLLRARLMHIASTHIISLRSVIVSTSHLRLGLPTGLLSSYFPAKYNLYAVERAGSIGEGDGHLRDVSKTKQKMKISKSGNSRYPSNVSLTNYWSKYYICHATCFRTNNGKVTILVVNS